MENRRKRGRIEGIRATGKRKQMGDFTRCLADGMADAPPILSLLVTWAGSANRPIAVAAGDGLQTPTTNADKH